VMYKHKQRGFDMKSIYFRLVAGLLLCLLGLPGIAQSGDTQGAAAKKVPAGSTGSLGSGGITGQAPVGAMGQAPVGATGSLGSGSVTGKTAPRGVMRRVNTQGASGSKKMSNEEEEDEEDDTE